MSDGKPGYVPGSDEATGIVKKAWKSLWRDSSEQLHGDYNTASPQDQQTRTDTWQEERRKL